MNVSATKTCKVCAEEFTPWSEAQRLNRFCGPLCAAKWGHEKALKRHLTAARKERAKAREKLKTRSDWTREAQTAFNAFIRARDCGKPCISCGSMPEQRYGGAMDCGHYRSVGAAPHLRFHAFNAAGQCKKCNRDLSGNTVEMRKGMALRFGLDKLRQVEGDDQTRKYTADDLKRIKRIFQKRARIYRKLRGQ